MKIRRRLGRDGENSLLFVDGVVKITAVIEDLLGLIRTNRTCTK